MDLAVAAMRGKVRAKLDPAMADGAARVTLRLRDSTILTETVLHARGSLHAPLTDSDLEAKLRDCARQGGFAGDVGALIAAVWSLDEAVSVAPLMELTRA